MATLPLAQTPGFSRSGGADEGHALCEGHTLCEGHALYEGHTRRVVVVDDRDFYGPRAYAGEASGRGHAGSEETKRPSARGARRTSRSRHDRGRGSDELLSNAERARRQREPHHVALPVRLALCALVVVALGVAVLAGPFGTWYCAWRENTRLSQQLDALQGENDQLQGEVDALLTPDGIKDKARSLGYVEEGETRVVVSDARGGSESSGGTDVATSEADEPWYIRLLDEVYGCQDQ